MFREDEKKEPANFQKWEKKYDLPSNNAYTKHPGVAVGIAAVNGRFEMGA